MAGALVQKIVDAALIATSSQICITVELMLSSEDEF